MKTIVTPRVYFFLMLAGIFLQAFNISFAQCAQFKATVSNGPVVNKCSSNAVQLMAAPAGPLYTYQWQQQTTAGGPFDEVAGANASTLETGIAGAYRVIVSNGSCTDTSSITSVLQLDLQGGSISGGPSGSICSDSYVGALSGAGVPGEEAGLIKYQWQIKTGNGAFTDIPLATGLQYNAGYIKATTAYRRAVIDNCGNSAFSNELTFTVYTQLIPGQLQPAMQTVGAGATPAAITSATPATGAGTLTYKWQYSLSATGPWLNIDNANSASYTPSAIHTTTYFRRIVYTDVCSYTATSEPVLVQLSNPLVLNAGLLYSTNTCLFAGNTPQPVATKIAPTGGTPPYSITWQKRTAATAWEAIPNQHSDKLFPGPITESTTYRKLVTDAANNTAYTDSVTLNVITLPLDAGAIYTTSAVACLGSSPAQILSSRSAANFGEKGGYQWQVKTENGEWVNLPGATRGYFQPQPLTEKTTFRRMFFDSCGANGRVAYSNEVVIETRPALQPGLIGPATQLVIPGRTPRVLTSVEAPSGGTAQYNIWWEAAPLATGPFTMVQGATQPQYQPPAANQTTYYRRVVRDVNCQAEKISYVVEVFVPEYPALVGGTLAGNTCVFASMQPAPITSGSVAPAGGIGPYSWQWESRAGNAAFAAIPNANSESYQPPVLTQTMQYRRKMTDAYGSLTYSDTFTIQLVSTPLVPGTIAAQNNSVCAGAAPGTITSVTDASGYGTNGYYQWQHRTMGGLFQNIAGANGKAYAPPALTVSMAYRRVFVDACGTTSRLGYSNEVVIKATPVSQLLPGVVQAPFMVCAGTTPDAVQSVIAACGSCNLVYQWQVATDTGWQHIAGAASAAYQPSALTQNTRYRRMVTDGLGNIAYSNQVEILVTPNLEAGTIGSDTQRVCKNTLPAQLTLVTDCHYATGGINYQWQASASASGPFTNVEGATSPAYQPPAAGTTTYYRLRVSSSTCNATAFTNTAVVLVNDACNVQVAASAQQFTDCQTKLVTLTYPTVPCNSANVLEWEYRTGSAGEWKGTGSGANDFTIRSYYQADTRLLEWRLKVTNNLCNSVWYTNTVTVQQLACRATPIVYPNPVQPGGILFVRNDDSSARFALLTVDGKRLPIKLVATSRGLARLQIPSSLAAGTYILQIAGVHGKRYEKIVVSAP